MTVADAARGLLGGRRAIVTGAASGIGLGIAQRFLAEGALVTFVDVDGAQLRAALEGLPAERRPSAHSVTADVSVKTDVMRAVHVAAESMGGVDALVNNAGINVRGDAIDFAEEAWERVLDVNLKGTFLMSQAAARVMRESGRGGAIVNLSSTSAEAVRNGHVAYASSKGGIRQLTKVLAVEWGEYGIRVNAVAPGGIRTPRIQRIVDVEGERRFTSKMALGRMGLPADVAAAAVFLVSDEADFVTGATLLTEGGVLAIDPREPARQRAEA